MSDVLLIDTDVLIDLLRHRPEALAYLIQQTGRLLISVITVTELHAGVREGRETTELEALLSTLEIMPIDREIAVMAGEFQRFYQKSHRLGIADTLIAATAIKAGANLVTLNHKHFPMIPHLIKPYERG